MDCSFDQCKFGNTPPEVNCAICYKHYHKQCAQRAKAAVKILDNGDVELCCKLCLDHMLHLRTTLANSTAFETTTRTLNRSSDIMDTTTSNNHTTGLSKLP